MSAMITITHQIAKVADKTIKKKLSQWDNCKMSDQMQEQLSLNT